MQTRNANIYLLVLLSLGGVLLVALGGGVWGQQGPWRLEWQHQLFEALCHQNPARSFWINGRPMAVCSRCLGIYVGFAAGWLLLPGLAFINYGNRWSYKGIALAIALLNIADIVGNILGFWQNTLVSRLVFGVLLGCSAALCFSGDFFKRTNKSTGTHHGRITANKYF